MLSTASIGSPASTGPGSRALYLGHGGRKRVSCTDTALVVTNANAQTHRYPVARLSRVVSSPLVDWSGAALALCMRSGIGITWIDSHGDSLGSLYPLRRGNVSFATALELLVETAQGLARYQDWLRSRRMAVLIQWTRTSDSEITPHEWEATKREWVYAARIAEHLPRALRGHSQAWVAAQLSLHHMPPVLWGPEGQGIDLDDDLTELLWGEMNLCTGGLADTTFTERELTSLFERWISSNGSALLLHLHSLQRLAMKELAT